MGISTITLFRLFIISFLTTSCMCSNVLVLMPLCSKSHKISVDPLMEELAKRGHQVTEVTVYKTSKPHPNIQTIYLKDSLSYFDKMGAMASNLSTAGNLKMIVKFGSFLEEGAMNAMNDSTFRAFITNPGHYDVVISSTIMNDVGLTLLPEIAPGIPLILLSPSSLFPYIAWELDIPNPWSYIPVQLTSFATDMTFFQRVINTLATGGFHLRMSYVSPITYNVIKSALPNANLADARDVERNASLVLINSHFSFTGPKPSMPYAVEIGGMHCRPAEKLPQDFSKFVEGAGEDGFIVFSLGSLVQAKHMPENVISSFQAAFKQLSPVRVIWKYEEQLEGISPNVLISKWIPQQDLIGHPKCRLAITHGGLLSLQEANYHGVPVLGIPLGGDRDSNLALAVQKGLAKTLEWDKITPQIALDTIKSIIYNGTYKQTVEHFGQLMRDRPQTPLQTAAYWVEYIIRYKGAKHLKSAAQNLNFFQYFLLDVILFILAVVIGVLFLFYRVSRFAFRKLFSKKPKSKMN